MLFWIGIDTFDGITLFHVWQHFILVRVIIDSQISIKLDLTAIGGKLDTILPQLNIHSIKDCCCHLTGYKTVPNQRIELKLILVQILCDAFWSIENAGRTNGLMGILSARSVLGLAAMFGIFGAKFIRDKACCFILRHRADTSRVGTHIRNQTLYARTDINPFIELLSHHHGLTSPKINLISGILLHRGSRVGQRSIASTLFLFDTVDCKVITLEVRQDFFDLIVVSQLHLFTIHTIEAGLKLTSSFLEGSVNCPVFFWFEGIDFIFTVDNQLERDRLHPTS